MAIYVKKQKKQHGKEMNEIKQDGLELNQEYITDNNSKMQFQC